MLIGIDEVGRGAWAGPLLIVAARQKKLIDLKLRDSKKLSKAQRQNFYVVLAKYCDFGEGWVSPAEIDSLGLTGAMRLGVSRALSAISCEPSASIIMDGTINYCAEEFINISCVARADDIYPIVSAASIYAKVVRDKHMVEQAQKYPDYGFDTHVGYGTKNHIDALKLKGVCKIHRLSYKPVGAMA